MFHSVCGRQATVTEDGWAAYRRDFASHFNNAIVASRRPLEQGELFEVRLVKKQTTWSGSIKIGISPTPPEKLDFPTSMVGLRDGSVVLSDHNVTVNGETRYEQYSSDSLDNLAEGGSVGVVISNCSAYFHVNGQNLGPAVSDLPSVPYWVLIDLYGQCVEVKIAPREMERASNSDTAIPLSFHSRCGRFVHLSNNKRSASRIKAIDEFNNGVVLSNRPLNDHELFEVVIVEKVSKWSGSLELGVTANKPEVLEIPSSVSEVKDGMWVLSSNGVVRASDGTTSDTYGATAVDDLPATSRVGVMRKGNGNLHFYINGIDQGVAATHVPSNVYAIVDIYGQTAGVSLSDSTGTMIGLPASAAINIRSYESSVDPLKFHKKCGKFAKIAGNSRTAHRIKPSEEFNYGIVMSDRPLDDNELFEVEIKQLVDRWSGSLEIGVSTQNPEGYEFPSSSMNMRSGTWIMSGSTVQCDGHILCCSYDSDLDILKVGDRVGVLRRTNGDLHFYINGRDLGRAAQQLPARVFGVVDVYGKCSQVALTSDYDGSGKVENSTRSPRSHRNTAETLSSLLGRLHHHDSGRIRHLLGGSNNSSDSESDSSDSSSSNTLDVIATGIEMMGRNEDGPICFHRKCGSNAIINPGRRIANRRNPESEFNGAVCLTSRQLQSGELFEVEINQVISRWSGSLEMGVTLIHPDELDFPDTMTDITYDTWILSGSTVMKGGSLTLRDYTIDLDSIQPGNRIGVMRRENGDLHFYQDGKDVGLAVKDVPPGVYGVVDLYGQCAQVTITSTTSLSDNRGTNTESLFSPPGGWEGLHRFHHYCGRSISMRANNRAARRTASFNNGIVLSSEPLRNGELFEVRIGHMARRWAGSIEIGLTTFGPDELHQTGFPDTCTSFSRGTWVVSGSTVLMNGSTHKESYCESLDSLKEGDRVGVIRESDGSMHIHINGEDRGIATTGIPPVVYAVVDLYGQTEEVVITSKKYESPESNFRAPDSKTEISRKEEAVTPAKPIRFEFWKNCGKHIKLSNGNQTATRTSSYNCGLVCSHVPLPENQPFQVRVLHVNQTWSGSLMIGVVGEEPDDVVIKQTAAGLKKDAIIVNSSSVTVNNTKVKDRYCKNLESLTVGDEIGVVRKRGGGVHILINGEDQGEASPNVPPICYAVVDVYGMTEKIKIVNLGEDEKDDSDDEKPVEDNVMKWMDSEVKEEVNVSADNIHGNNQTLMSKPRRVHLPVPDKKCLYQELCYRFITSLAIPKGFMNPKYDRCYCVKCHRNRGDNDYYTRGDPPATYALPIGWARKSLEVPPRAVSNMVGEKWHVAYHGTQAKNVRPILDAGDLLFPGDITLGGTKINEAEGHYNDKWKPQGFDTKQIFLSPSMKYAGLQVYAKKQQFIDPLTKKEHEARVAFQVWISPNSYSKGKLTVKHSGQIDQKFPNSEIEWSTKQRGAVILYGLLAKIENP